MITLTNTHLMMLRCLRLKGWELCLKSYLLSRHGAAEEDYAALLATKLVRERKGRIELTKEGRREYRRQKVGKWF